MAAAKKLVANVIVNGTLYGPDSSAEVTDEVAAEITNPKAWADQPEPEKPQPKKSAKASK